MLYPRLSVIVPSYNQAAFIEETLLSILEQNYPELELIVIDGGSTDGSVEIIKKYDSQIKYWVSEPDRGQSHAINKGLQRATGEWVAWMNSDDCYLPGAFSKLFLSGIIPNPCKFIYGNVLFGIKILSAKESNSSALKKLTHFELLLFFKSAEFIIPSQSVFLHKELIAKIGYIDEAYHFCMDLEWYSRVFCCSQETERLFIETAYSFFRIHEKSKTSKNYLKMQEEAILIAERYSNNLSKREEKSLLNEIKLRRWLLENFFSGNTRKFWSLLVGLFRFNLLALRDNTYNRLVKELIKRVF